MKTRVLELGPVTHHRHLEDLRVRDQPRDAARGVLVLTVVSSGGDHKGRTRDVGPSVLADEVAAARVRSGSYLFAVDAVRLVKVVS